MAVAVAGGERLDSAWRDVVVVLRGLLVAGGVIALLPVVASLVLRQVDVETPRLVAYVAATPFVLAAGACAIVLFVLGGSRIGTAVAAVLTSILALTQAPLYLGTGAPATGAEPLTVMTINTHFGGADATQIVRAVRERRVDVLATQELSPEAVADLHAAGIGDLLPHDVISPRDDASGNGLWSRSPLVPIPVAAHFRHTPLAATTTVAGTTVMIASVHAVSPYPDDTAEWSAELGRLADWLGSLDGSVVVAGDFNATLDHHQFRKVLATGFADAASQVGAGWLPTYPANRRRLPMLITIDHVIANAGIVATDVDRLELPGTDHAALVVRLAVPPGV